MNLHEDVAVDVDADADVDIDVGPWICTCLLTHFAPLSKTSSFLFFGLGKHMCMNTYSTDSLLHITHDTLLNKSHRLQY